VQVSYLFKVHSQSSVDESAICSGFATDWAFLEWPPLWYLDVLTSIKRAYLNDKVKEPQCQHGGVLVLSENFVVVCICPDTGIEPS